MSDEQSIVLVQIKNFSHESPEFKIHQMNLFSCTNNTLSVSLRTSRLRIFKGMFDCVEQTVIKMTVYSPWHDMLSPV